MNEINQNKNYHGLIYKTTNLINNKIYIGQTTNIICWQKGKYKGSGDLINIKLKEYGFENFKSEFICYASNQEELNNLEIKYIAEYNSLAPNGYNLHKGGNQVGKGYVAVKDKIGNTFQVSIEDPRYLSGELVGIMKNTHINLGIKRSDKTKNLLSNINKNYFYAKDIMGNRFRITKDDLRFISGELFHHSKNSKLTKAHKEKIGQTSTGRKHTEQIKLKISINSKGKNKDTITVKDKDGNKFRVHKTDSRWISGELVGATKGNKNASKHII